jgi:succinate dehydrogenase/fumarate reductase flavoprotein subunit
MRSLPDQRSGARRRRPAEVARRHTRFMPNARRARRTRAARRGGPRHRLRDEEARPRLRAPRHLAPAARFMQEHFPNILARCLELGIDITREPIPVVPAAHYTCGGVLTDLSGPHRHCPACTPSARPPTPACTAPTGWPATRWSSAWCSRAPRPDILARAPVRERAELPAWDDSRVTDADEAVVISHNWDELRRFMWDYVGIVRTNKRLERAATASSCCRPRSRSSTRTSTSRATCWSCATWCRWPS